MMKAGPARGGGRGRGEGGVIADLIPSLITHDLAIYDSCLCPVASPEVSLNWTKKGEDAEISQTLLLFLTFWMVWRLNTD